jgi:hypothetical protein
MRGALVLFAILMVVVSSGCVSETGEVIINFTDFDSPEQEAGIITQEPNITNETAPPKENITEDEPENITHDLCADKICDESISTCPDGEAVTCENECDPETGLCSSCFPDCSGHQLPEECEFECGDCEHLDEEECECIIILYCEGNGICEPTNDEWPDSIDCVGFGGCDDDDACTQDTFNPNQQLCIHTDICCDDGDDCTVDYYNYTTDECEHSYACCGNMVCEPENGETEESCPLDCFEEEEEPGDVLIADIDPEGEIVTIEGYGIDLDGWSIEDAASNLYNFTGFVIDGFAYLHSIGDPADNNETDLYWGTKDGGPRSSPIWNNDGDTATLRNDSGYVVYTFTYP